jgi:hypothetical protein
VLRPRDGRFEKRDEIVSGAARCEQVHIESGSRGSVGEQREASDERVGLGPALEERADEIQYARDIHRQ